jgi:ATP-binding cassette subfamily C protein
MLKAIKASLVFMTPKERYEWFLLTGLRAFLSIFDLLGILAIGLVVTSTAIFLTSGSDANRVLDFAGLQIPAVNAQSLPWVSAGVLGLFLVKAVFSVILTKKAAYFVATVEASSAKTIAETSFGGDLSDARKRSREEMMYAIQAGSPSAFNGLLNAANTLATESMLFVVVCIGFLFIDPLATLAAVIYFGVTALVIQHFVGSRMSRAGQIAAEQSVKANTAISDLLSVFRELLVLGKRDRYIDGIYKARLAAAESAANQHYLSGMPRYVIEAALLIGVAIFVLSQALAGDIVKSATTIGVFLSGGFRLTAALLPLQNALLVIKSTVPSATTAHQILEISTRNPQGGLTSIPELGQAISEQDISHEEQAIGLEFKSVGFSYPGSDEATLTDVSFEIKAGSQVALIGPSGAGKSTIADLICQVVGPTSGTILRTNNHGEQIEHLDSASVSYVPQKPGVVSGTILDNIALGLDSQAADRNLALESIRLAHLADLIEGLPDGLDTYIGKLQDGLSGGQMQRLGLARALYTKPSLLVMDEATSALDAESEAQIRKALDEMRGRVTVVLIAHRLNTIQHAHDVILIEAGRVRDSGTFQELMARNPSIRRVVGLSRVGTD